MTLLKPAAMLLFLAAAFDGGVYAAKPPTPLGHFTGWPLFATLPDGTLWAFIRGGTKEAPQVLGEISTDSGFTWSETRVVLTLPARSQLNLSEALADRKGEIHFFYIDSAHYKEGRLDLWHSRSADGRTRWLPPKLIWKGYTGALNSVIQMRSGRILLPFSFMVKRNWGNRGTGPDAFTYVGNFSSTVIYSDDGDTWRLSPDELKVSVPDLATEGALEPVVIELKNGLVWMLIRTQWGRFYESFSKDGARWSEPQPTRIVSSDSPAGLARLKDGRILLLWNGCLRFPYAYGGRHVLHGAVSLDEGRAWRGFREVARFARNGEPPPPNGDFGVTYPILDVVGNGDVLVRAGAAQFRLDPAWLDETRQKSDFVAGADDWSIFGTRGVEIKDHLLSIHKAEREWPAAAVWNFPIGARGRLRLNLMLHPGFSGANIGLTDHYSVPFDPEDRFHNVFNLALETHLLAPGRWHKLEFIWDTARRECRVLIDGRALAPMTAMRASEGINYLRLRSTAEESDAGMSVAEVDAEVLP